MSQTHYRPEDTATRLSGSNTLTITRDSLQDVELILGEVCQGLAPDVDAALLLAKVRANVYDGLSEEEYWQAMVMAARSCIEAEPAYTFVAARLLLLSLYKEALTPAAAEHLSLADAAERYQEYLASYVAKGVALGQLDSRLLEYDLAELGRAIVPQRDLLFSYPGLQTLYDRYLLQEQEQRFELPQLLWMRVSMGLALNEPQKEVRAKEFYDLISQLYFTPATPTLFNAGTNHPQLSSCYLTTVSDDLEHIFKCVQDNAMLSKWAGGLGNDWTNVRALGAHIKGTNGRSQGIIPFLKVANDTAVAVNQCFAPDTLVYTADGCKPISEIKAGNLVLGHSGNYREVTEVMMYDQVDPMVEVNIKHSIENLTVTSGHPFYAIKGVPLEQTNSRTMEWLAKGKVQPEWVDAGKLSQGDYVAQVVPKEIISVQGFTEEDARLYGVLLGDGHLSKDGMQWGVSGNPEIDTHLDFVRNYLETRGIHYWESGSGDSYHQIHWASGRGVVRDVKTGRISGKGEPTLPFTIDDIYDNQHNKHISRRFSHLPYPQTRAMLHGLLETDGGVSRGVEIYFTTTSQPLAMGVRYQLLRLGIPSAGQYRERLQSHTGVRSDGSKIAFSGTVTAFDIRVPAVEGLAELLGCRSLTKRNWLDHQGMVFTRVREVKETEVSPTVFDLKVEGDETYMTVAGLVHNGGKRKGAVCAYLENWHLDIEDFLDLRKNTGDDRRRTHDMNTASWISDLFMQRVQRGEQWTLFSPDDVPDLHNLYGAAFARRYGEYERMVDEGRITLFKRLPALDLWRKMLTRLFETGHPWITWKDPSNVRSPQDHTGVVHSSNLCTEILLNTSADETAVCNLGSVNLSAHISEGQLDLQRLRQTVTTAMRMLDNVIDINYYPTAESRTANLRHRPVGLGIMGFQDALYKLGYSYASEAAVTFADRSTEAISFYAISASTHLAEERGVYGSYQGSKWQRGLLPIDTIYLLAEERGESVEMDRSTTLDWSEVRALVSRYGMRNSNVMAIAPTATISTISGVSQSIEPTYKNLYVKSNLSGEFTSLNTFLVQDLKQAGLWNAQMLEAIKYYDGSLLEIAEIPDEIRQRYLTTFEVEPEWLIESASRRQKWIDMGQSLNLYLAQPNGKKLQDMYQLAWRKGLKTTYYLRTLAATQVEKSTLDVNRWGIQPRWMKNASASSDVEIVRDAQPEPDPALEEISGPVCMLGEDCEACQ